MRIKTLRGALCVLTTVMTVVGLFPIKAYSAEYTVDEVNSLIDGIIGYKLDRAGAGCVQEWIDGELTRGAGTLSEWYIMTLSQYGDYDFSSYESTLSSYLAGHDESSATSREKYALALSASGSGNSYMSDILDSSIGQQGIMSYIYGLHVLNNGYSCTSFTAESVADRLVSMQYGDGGWALFGEYGDIDVTAMTILALSPYYGSDPDVHSAVDRGIDFLSQRQQDNGGYQSFGTPNPESTSQVLTAVSALGIDCIHDGRFIKNGNTLIDGILEYRLPEGGYCHMLGGDVNDTATVQALYSFIAYKRMHEGRSPLLIFDNRKPVEMNEQSPSGAANTEQNISAEEGSSQQSGSQPYTIAVVTTSAETTVTAVTTAVSRISVSKSITSSAVMAVQTVSSSVTTSAVTTTMYKTHSAETPTKKSGTKTKAVLIIAGAAALVSLILFLLKKRNIKNYAFVLLCAGAGIAVVFLSDIRSAEDYYNGSYSLKDSAVGTVTMEIRCDTIVGKSDSDYIPEDGTILDVTTFEIEEGDTVFDILTEAAQTYGIQMENKGSAGSAHGMVYISGINYIYEYDFGDLSGWVYHVNGITPSRNCGEYILSDGDEIQWLYTCELGHDLNEVYEDDGVLGT